MKTFSTIIITAIVVGVGVYFWQSSLEPSGVDYEEVDVQKEDEKDDHFSFTVPAGYTIAEGGLWKESRYQNHLDCPDCGDGYHVADILIVDMPFDGDTLDEFVRGRHGTAGYEYEEGNEWNNYKVVNIEGRDFIRIMAHDMATQLGYYTEYRGRAVGFVNPMVSETPDGHPDPKDDEFLLEIVKTIKLIN